MTQPEALFGDRASLVDAVDRLLNRGVVLVGHTTISLAGVDLVYLGLNLILSSVETLDRPLPPGPPPRHGEGGARAPDPSRSPSGPIAPYGAQEAGAACPEPDPSSFPPRHGERPGEGEAGGERSPLPQPQPRPYSSREASGPTPLLVDSPPAALALSRLPERVEGESGARPEQGLARLVLALVELLRQILERQALRRMEGERLSADEVERMGLALQELEAKMAELREVFGLTAEDLNLDLGPLGRLLE